MRQSQRWLLGRVWCWRSRVAMGTAFWIGMIGCAGPAFPAVPESFSAGVARADITPREAIRLTGYAVRQEATGEVEQRLWVKALALGPVRESPVVLVTIDNCGIGLETYRTALARLTRQAGLKPEEVALAVSHTHTGPCTTGFAPNIFARDIPSEQQTVIDRYTKRLLDQLHSVVIEAINSRRPAELSWAQGMVGFAANRRTAGGPVDQTLPVLKVESAGGDLIALVANYACHCTTLGGGFNKVCGDWAGYAQEKMEQDHPGAMAFITIGCGADANPQPRGGADGGLALARKHGLALAQEVNRLLAGKWQRLESGIETAVREIALPFGKPFTRAQWEDRARQDGIVGYHARKNLARLNAGEPPARTLEYPIVTWRFGSQLAWVFLPGEVVVDYALRLKGEFDPERLWITAYANHVPCYIPSRRILSEGGYEAETSLWYYDRPTRLAPETEELILETVRVLVPSSYRIGTVSAP